MKEYDAIATKHRAFIADQKMFFVATAPMSGGAEGRINLSPKGLEGSFVILDDHTVAYLDLVGSGVETIAHVKENGRICLMFCAFDGKPNILRLQGIARVVEPADEGFEDLKQHFTLDSVGVRSVICVDVQRVADSCGFGVPIYEYVGQRDVLTKWADAKGPEGIRDYQLEKNRTNIGGLPGVALAD